MSPARAGSRGATGPGAAAPGPGAPRPGADTRVFALLGDPVAHSLSPRIQNAAFAAAGLDAVYVALRCDGGDIAGLLTGLARAGGGGNVTVPHKLAAARAVEAPTAAVTRTGACNTFWLKDGRVCGDNTDVAGFAAAATTLAGPLADSRTLVVGAGGAARAVVCALLDAHVSEILVLNRTPGRARALIDAMGAGGRLRLAADADSLRGESFDLVVNATSLGLRDDDADPVDLDALGAVGAALDLVYSPHGTRWSRAARERGITAADGTEMLLQQAAAAFQRWHRRPAPLEAMRQALQS